MGCTICKTNINNKSDDKIDNIQLIELCVIENKNKSDDKYTCNTIVDNRKYSNIEIMEVSFISIIHIMSNAIIYHCEYNGQNCVAKLVKEQDLFTTEYDNYKKIGENKYIVYCYGIYNICTDTLLQKTLEIQSTVTKTTKSIEKIYSNIVNTRKTCNLIILKKSEYDLNC
jgi:hypothetical protein